MSSSDSLNYDEIRTEFVTKGYCILPGLFSRQQMTELKAEMSRLVAEFSPEEHSQSIFTTGTAQSTDRYFLESADKVRYFLEESAIDPETGRLTVPKERCLNKIGHALHWWSEPFRRFTFGDQLKRLARDALRLEEPLIVQSMIIFKNPEIGGRVAEHQDASYLHTLPKPDGAVVGVWIPLEDATIENGCLEFVPGSHRSTPLPTRWIRTKQPDGSIKMVHTNPGARYQGDFVPAPVPAGSCVLIDGLVVHRSAPNHSPRPRPIYTFHVFDQGRKADADGQAERVWDPNNWLQPTQQLPFQSLYNN